jgi:hypothetical protein
MINSCVNIIGSEWVRVVGFSLSHGAADASENIYVEHAAPRSIAEKGWKRGGGGGEGCARKTAALFLLLQAKQGAR